MAKTANYMAQPSALLAASFPRLEKAEADLGVIASPHVPPGIEHFLSEWASFLSGRGVPPGNRALTSLSWHPGTATSAAFCRHLERCGEPLSGRALEGLIRSCHSRWHEARRSGAVALARRQLAGFAGRRRRLMHWKTRPEILSEEGPSQIGRYWALDRQGPDEAAAALNLDADSEFARQAVQATAGECRRNTAAEERWNYLVRAVLPWKRWSPAEFKHEFGATVVWAQAHGDGRMAELAKFARNDARLGDPRQARNNPNWAGLVNARAAIIACLSRFDIQFFFDHVLPRRADPHGRKQFWLQYVNRLLASRSALGRPDRERLDFRVVKDTARLDTTLTSAFILDFGNIMAVEFSQTGNACYFYGRQAAGQIVPDVWANEFSLTRLKDQHRKSLRVIHRTGWQEEASQELAKHGIRP